MCELWHFWPALYVMYVNTNWKQSECLIWESRSPGGKRQVIIAIITLANGQVSKTSKADMAELRESKQVLTIEAQPTSSPQLSIADQVAIQEQAQDEVSARSLIISGLSEFADISDINKVLEEAHITTAIPLLPEDIVSVARLGSTSKVRTGSRLIRVVLAINRQ